MNAETMLAQLREQIENEYRQRTPKSCALHQQAQAYLPGGDTRTGTSFAPYPTYIEHAEGSCLHDVDGNAILDFTNNATALIHGHAHPNIVKAIQQQAACGTAWAAPNPHQVRLAQMLCARVPSLERVRFCNSGTEANMLAIKAARAFTGRDKLLKMDTAYHGTYDGVEFSLSDQTGVESHVRPTTRGVPRNAADNLLVAPFNDLASAERLIRENRHELAAVVVNPVLISGGVVLPTEGYLASLREITRACGVLLIFDEVISLRIAAGGAQAYYGVVPDLTAMGKIIGGGLPVGAFGGRAEIMELFVDGNPPAVSHAGTFNGNPLTMAAGAAALELLTPEAYQRLAGLGRLLQDRLAEIAADRERVFEVSSIASLVSLGPAQAIRTERTATLLMSEVIRLMQLALLNRGIKTYRLFAISTVMSEAEIEQLASALRDVLEELRPGIEAVTSTQQLSVNSEQ